MNAPQYWRSTKTWPAWLGRTGKVVAVTKVYAPPAGLEDIAPYNFVLVEFPGGERAEFIGIPHETLTVGDQVWCVFRRGERGDGHSVVSYGIKVAKFKL